MSCTYYSNKLVQTHLKQVSIFEMEDEKSQKLKLMRQQMFEKFGMFTVRSASTAFAKSVFDDVVSNFEICDIEGKFCF